ncbi:MAG: alpha/beta hydrolase, partial [Anaerolineae bacterium]
LVGVGHSLGGVLTLWAAIARPDLFRAVVLVDPVILPARWLWMLRLLRLLGLGRHQPLVQGALRRRHTWPDRQACFHHLRGKALFARWSDDALWDYVEAGTQARPGGGIALRYPPEWEARIFATPPTRIWRDVPHLDRPALILRGERSQTFRPEAQARLGHLLPGARLGTIAGAGHLLPMEQPAATAAAIRDFLATAPPAPRAPGPVSGPVSAI